MDEWLSGFKEWITDKEEAAAQALIFIREILPRLSTETLQKVVVATLNLQARKLNSLRAKAVRGVRKNCHINHSHHPCRFCAHLPHICKGSR